MDRAGGACVRGAWRAFLRLGAVRARTYLPALLLATGLGLLLVSAPAPVLGHAEAEWDCDGFKRDGFEPQPSGEGATNELARLTADWKRSPLVGQLKQVQSLRTQMPSARYQHLLHIRSIMEHRYELCFFGWCRKTKFVVWGVVRGAGARELQ